MFSFCFGERNTDFVFLLPLSFEWCGAIAMDILDALVAAVSFGIRSFLEMYTRVLEQLEVMCFAWSESGTYDFSGSLADHYLAFSGVAFLLA